MSSGFYDQHGTWVPQGTSTLRLPCQCDAKVTGGTHRPWCPGDDSLRLPLRGGRRAA